jgi:intraflagellar transport protein 140
MSQQYDLIREIADNVEYKNDPETLKSLAEYFVDQGHDDKALGTYIRLKDYDTALKLCEAKNLKISPETADSIFDELDIKTENEAKKKLLKKLAKQLTTQGDFELAHQKYVQMGNLKKAMKCLIKLGDKDKVIHFATTSRFMDNYILAANFLQSLDWNDNPEIVKLIVTFFKKAKAYDNLSNFYCLCATVEINDYRNYDKALEALQEAKTVLKQEMSKEMNDEEKQKVISKEEELTQKITLTKLFLHTCSVRNNQPQEALKECTELLGMVNL